SSLVPCAKRGYQASGAAMVRPSDNSTDRVSSFNSMLTANASLASTAEELIPKLHQLFAMNLNQSMHYVNFPPTKAMTPFEPNRFEPKLRFAIVAFDVDVRGLAPITGIEKSVRSNSHYRRHIFILCQAMMEINILKADRHKITLGGWFQF